MEKEVNCSIEAAGKVDKWLEYLDTTEGFKLVTHSGGIRICDRTSIWL